ncbi:MAG TPA: SDR family oxidoreductase [Actinomycetota bacterium]
MTRTVAITGASTGIGEACALALDAKGWRVFAGVRKEADGAALRAKASDRLTPLILDVTDGTQIRAAAATVADAVGDAGLDGLVNNAGIAVAGPMEFVPLDDLRRQLEINVVGLVATTQAFLPLIRRASGRIVHMGSVGGSFAVPFAGPYSASKFAVEAITDAMRVELAPWRIHVALVKPGAVATPLWDRSTAIADEMLTRVPPETMTFYGTAIERMRELAAHEAASGIAPEKVATVVVHALTSMKPRTRYVLGPQAGLRVTLSRLLPDRTRDKLVVKQTGLPGEGSAR